MSDTAVRSLLLVLLALLLLPPLIWSYRRTLRTKGERARAQREADLARGARIASGGLRQVWPSVRVATGDRPPTEGTLVVEDGWLALVPDPPPGAPPVPPSLRAATWRVRVAEVRLRPPEGTEGPLVLDGPGLHAARLELRPTAPSRSPARRGARRAADLTEMLARAGARVEPPATP